jgi:predicted phage tail protein
MSDAPAQDRFEAMLADANDTDLSIDERNEQLEQQRLTLEEIEQRLRDARQEREARYERAVQRLEDGNDDTCEVLSDDD